MPVPSSHILRQTPVIAALMRTAATAVARKAGVEAHTSIQTPTAPIEKVVPPRHPRLVADYVRALGGDPGWYRRTVPAHLFPQWGFPLFERLLEDVPYDITKALNGGCRIVMHQPIPAGERLHLRATLEDIDDDGRRAILHQKLVTGTKSAPDAVESHLFAFVPLAKREKGAKKKEKPRVPQEVREDARWRLTPETAWEFAVLTGDFNPIHWIPAAAHAAGFRNTILHGFATLGLAIEGLNRARFAGNPRRLQSVDVRFTRPLVLPRQVGLYLGDEGALHVGDFPGGPAYLAGSYTTHES